MASGNHPKFCNVCGKELPIRKKMCESHRSGDGL